MPDTWREEIMEICKTCGLPYKLYKPYMGDMCDFNGNHAADDGFIPKQSGEPTTPAKASPPTPSDLSTQIEEILEKLHEKLLIGWIVNDGETHVVPSHGSNDGCTELATAQILSLFEEYAKGDSDA